ncbi:hypothetical protein Cgig2_006840 [Carnegiea gigantea]|uniref:DUF4283 domain-containing protein n=1 Tax=Carnegiea gigantea TaxID=171969 RepID=A0A9Q1GK48_9CARY|nr:hypothetical protein Cgig2_006840 [Carnegiea gigantea]
MAAYEINGTKCAKLVLDDVKEEIDYWQNALLFTVLGANPLLEVMKGFINRIWGNFEIDKILRVRKWIFLVRFVHLNDRIAVERKGLYFFDRKPFLVKSWNPEMDMHTEAIKSLPIWVQLPDLDINVLGIPIKTGKYTKGKAWIHYARLLIDIPIAGPFSEYIEFFNEHEMLVRQPVKYEWLPIKCHHCGMFGHEEQVCKKKITPRQEWRPVTKPPAAQSTITPEDKEGFTQIPGRAVAKPLHMTKKTAVEKDLNSFQILTTLQEEAQAPQPSTTPNPP